MLEGMIRYLKKTKQNKNTVGGLLAARRVFCCYRSLFFLFLFDKLRRKHPFKHANKKKVVRRGEEDDQPDQHNPEKINNNGVHLKVE